MLDLRLEHVGGGQFRTRFKLDFDLCAAELEPGEHVRAKVTKQRSVRQNDYFHALIEAAFENQRGGPVLPSWRHLKGWLLIQVGHCDVKQFSARSMTPDVAAYLRKQFDTVDFSTDGQSIFMKTARSVSFKACDAEAMGKAVDDVVALICTDIVPGCSPDEILKMAKEKAA